MTFLECSSGRGAGSTGGVQDGDQRVGRTRNSDDRARHLHLYIRRRGAMNLIGYRLLRTCGSGRIYASEIDLELCFAMKWGYYCLYLAMVHILEHGVAAARNVGKRYWMLCLVLCRPMAEWHTGIILSCCTMGIMLIFPPTEY